MMALPSNITDQITLDAERYTKDEGYQKAYIAGATEYAEYNVKYERAKTIIERMLLRVEYLFDDNLLNEIKSFLDGK